ncbi:MAG: outer membrane protein assembly factor BamA [Saprospiraceae bacterium]|nr:outer membrane protein assembly factor BamA [Saprospiraceae bacterium]
MIQSFFRTSLLCLILGAMILHSEVIWAQTNDKVINYADTKEYEIGGIKVTGTQYSDETAIIAVSGLKVGQKIKIGAGSSDIANAIKSLWKLRLFTDINIYKEKTIGEVIFLEISLKERPRFTKHSFKGVKKLYHDDLNEVVNRFLIKGGIVTDDAIVNCRAKIEAFFIEKGYLDCNVKVAESPDEKGVNAVKVDFIINKGKKVKIQDIVFTGNDHVKARKLRKLLDNTKRRTKLFASSKLIESDYEKDKLALIKFYNKIGYRDATIVRDSIYRNKKGRLLIDIDINEGNRYYFRSIVFKGNSIFDSKTLNNILDIKKGDVYNNELLETRLRFSQDGRDISTQYMDNGYLFFQANPTEVTIENDSIDLEIRIAEGPQATIDKVIIKGNDRTNEHVIRRELRTIPGQKFSRTDIIRSQREIVNLGFFNPEALGINTPVNPQRGTVDIEYTVEEKPSDQLELSAGWGGYRGGGVIGTLGVAFNNFSIRNISKKETWNPLPQGDGQKLSIRAQTNGRYYQSYNLSFTEPWLGGKKPNSFTVAGFFNRFSSYLDKTSPNYYKFDILGVTAGLGSRLRWPDDNFIFNGAINIQRYSLKNYSNYFVLDNGSALTNGIYNNINLQLTIARNSINDPIFPREGSKFALTMQLTPPYSALGLTNLGSDASNEDKYRWLEYHRWRFDAEWYTPIVGKLTLRAVAKIGMLGYYNKSLGTVPFERWRLGGDGLSGQYNGFQGSDPVSMRGYEIDEIPASSGSGATVFDKFTVEIRYPISLNPSSTIFVLGFAEGANAWKRFRDFNPFDIKRSAGVGLRVYLPMFGLLGFDYGIGFDKPNLIGTNANLAKYGNFNFILGFQPD